MKELGSCAVEGCRRPRYGQTWCRLHLRRVRVWGHPTDKPARKKRPCSFESCERTHACRGFCDFHYRRWQRNGDPAVSRSRPRPEQWVNQLGYVVVRAPGHPNAFENRTQILQHRLVMSEMLGRPLRPHENVHHRNGDRTDNRPSNLELWVRKQPAGQRVEDLLAWAREILAMYAGEFPAARESITTSDPSRSATASNESRSVCSAFAVAS
jgi:hypothetical protein